MLLPGVDNHSKIMMFDRAFSYIFKVNCPIPALQVQHVDAMVRDNIQVLVHPVVRHAFHGLWLKTFPYEFWLRKMVPFGSREQNCVNDLNYCYVQRKNNNFKKK